MKFGLISLDFRRLPLASCFETAARLGFDGVEIWGGRPHAWPWDMDAAAVAEIKTLRSRYGLEIPMYTPADLGMGLSICSPSPKERAEAISHYRRSVDAAADMEVPMVLVVADHPGYRADAGDSWEMLVDAAVNLADYAAVAGVSLCFEPLTPAESPVLVTADDCVALLASVGRPNLCAMLDVVPPTVVCEPLSSYFTKLGDKMAYIHLCNSDGVTDAHQSLDDGVLDIPDVLDQFRAHGYDGFVTLELYSASLRDPEVLAATTMRLLKTYGA